MSDANNVLSGTSLERLCEQGKDAWNEWAVSHQGWAVNFRGANFSKLASFDGFHFPGPVNFTGSSFAQGASFDGAHFHGGDIIINSNISLNGGMSFKSATFHSANIKFSGMQIDKAICFDGAEFEKCSISFKGVGLANGEISLCGIHFDDGDITLDINRLVNSNLVFSGATIFGSKVSASVKDRCHECKIGFEDVTFTGTDLSLSVSDATACSISLSGAIFDRAKLSIDGVTGPNVDLDCSGTSFTRSKALISRFVVSHSEITLEEAKFKGSSAFFIGVKVADGSINFENSAFEGKGLKADGIQLKACDISFKGATFSGGNVSFYGAKFEEGKVDFSTTQFASKVVSFERAKFGKGWIDFSGVIFQGGNVKFSRAHFENDHISFNNASFSGDKVHFVDTDFSGNLLLESAKFECKEVSFNGMKVGRSLVLDKADFSVVPDFRNLSVNRDVSIIDMKVEYQGEGWMCFSRAKSSEHCDMYRKLKSMAANAKDHAREIEFFAMEERAKFGHQLNWFQYLPTLLYHVVSNFGRSIIRPLVGLFVIWAVAAGLFLSASSKSDFSISCAPSFFADDSCMVREAMSLSTSNIFPYFTWTRGFREDAISKLYGKAESNDCEIGSYDCEAGSSGAERNGCEAGSKGCEAGPSGYVEFIIYAESLLAIIFVFLIGLALRNRLRL